MNECDKYPNKATHQNQKIFIIRNALKTKNFPTATHY